MMAHRDSIAVVLSLALLFPFFGPLLGAPGAGSSCRCQGDSCCLRHGRPAPIASEPSHDDHHGHGSHGQTPEAATAAATVDEGASCHLPGSAGLPPAALKLSATCDAGSPVPAPPSVRRDAISGLEAGGHAVLIVSHGEPFARQWTLPASYFSDPPNPPPRSA